MVWPFKLVLRSSVVRQSEVGFRGSSMVERLPVKEMVPGSSPGRGA